MPGNKAALNGRAGLRPRPARIAAPGA